MKSPIANFALSLVLLSTSATFTTAIPAPLPAATGYASNSQEASEAEAARAQLRPIWRPGPRIDADSAPTASAGNNNLSVRGPIFRRNADSKFQYRRRASAGLAVAGNIAYGLEERDVAGPFGINQHVPLPVAMRVRRDLEERADEDEEEEDWDCSEYDDDEDEEEEGDQQEQWTAPASSAAPAPSSSSEAPKEEKPSSSSSAAPAPSSSAPTVNDSNNQITNPVNPLLKNKVVGTKKEESNSDSESQPEAEAPSSSPSSAEEVTPLISSEAAWIAPAPQSTTSSNVFVPEATKKASATKKKSKSKSKAASLTQPLQPTLTNPSNIAPGTLTVEQGCTRYHTVVAGEVCLGLLDGSRDLNLTLEQLYQYNPAIDSQCMNLQIGWGVCTGANPVAASSSSSSAAASSTSSSNNLKRRRGNQ